jgi:hypothetical protein
VELQIEFEGLLEVVEVLQMEVLPALVDLDVEGQLRPWGDAHKAVHERLHSYELLSSPSFQLRVPRHLTKKNLVIKLLRFNAAAAYLGVCASGFGGLPIQFFWFI